MDSTWLDLTWVDLTWLNLTWLDLSQLGLTWLKMAFWSLKSRWKWLIFDALMLRNRDREEVKLQACLCHDFLMTSREVFLTYFDYAAFTRTRWDTVFYDTLCKSALRCRHKRRFVFGVFFLYVFYWFLCSFEVPKLKKSWKFKLAEGIRMQM